MATKKKEEEALAAAQELTETGAQPAAQSGYSTAGLNNRQDVENALANSSYQPGQSVTDAEAALKEWQANRPKDYESSYQGKIDALLEQLLQRQSFQYSYTQDPLYRQYEQLYLQNAHNASADAAAQAAALTRRLWLQLRHQCGSAGLSAADRRTEQRDPHAVQPGAGHLRKRRQRSGDPAGSAEQQRTGRAEPL